MDFSEELRQFTVKAANLKPHIKNEETTKTALILPFLKILGYDIFNPLEVVPEYVADVGIKKGEKVDYAIIKDGAPVILIEAKCCNEDLSMHTGQLYRYFSVTTAKFGILTNGIEYKFYTDLEAQHKMDLTPFLEFSITDIKEDDIIEIKKFHKDVFNIDELALYASDLRYLKLIKNYFILQMQQPTNKFINFILGEKVNDIEIYGGNRMQSIVEKFKPIIKKSLISLINEEVNKRVAAALKKYDVADMEEIEKEEEDNPETENLFLRRLENATADVQNIYKLLKDYTLALGNDVKEILWKHYATFKKEKNIASVEVYRTKIQIFLRINPATVELEDGFMRDASKMTYGACNLLLILKNNADFEKAKPLIDRAYNEN